MPRIKPYSLYLVTSQEYSAGRGTPDVVKLAVSSGVDIVQLREKGLGPGELRRMGREVGKICAENGVIFVVNDDPYLAKELGADGVHLGQEDMARYTLPAVREVIGPGCIIGVSTHSIEEFRVAVESDIDYIAFGPIFATQTKDYTIGTADITRVMDMARKPVVFIGGINSANMSEVLERGGQNIAVISEITSSRDIRAKVRELKNRMEFYRGR
ncbi:MAG: thiamine phosphate synthase [Candidatus Omnitrophica bacterium]|nr:thiamine phosphate synthase [Candidatus Omnitrophota bacterium]MDD5487816.1 thiamine phosphate synthase [Candidatus Omnitrophota bacterium]